MFVDRHLAALAPLPAGYQALLGRLLDVAVGDQRVRAVWLGGSLGRGVADAGSDLDVILAEHAVPWPDELDAAVIDYPARELGW